MTDIKRLPVWSRVAAALACVFVIALVPALQPGGSARIDVSMWSEGAGVAQLFFDSGEGFSEEQSSRARVQAGANTLRFVVPSGAYVALRLDPINRDTAFEISDIRVRAGEVEDRISVRALHAGPDIAGWEVTDSSIRGVPARGANDPQIGFSEFPLERLHIERPWLARLSWAAAVAFGVVAFVAMSRLMTWRAIVTFAAFAALVLIARMCFVSTTQVSVHPDEFSHTAAYRYFLEHWLPPAVDDPRILPSVSAYGSSYLQELDVVYWIAARSTSILASAVPDPVLLGRVFNLALWLCLVAAAMRNEFWGAALGVALLTPQVWYVFSYLNGDAFPLVLSLLCAGMLCDASSGLNRYLHVGSKLTAGAVAFAVCIGLLLISKRNYLIVVPAFFAWIAIARLEIGWRNLIGALCGATAIMVAAFLGGVPGARAWKIALILFGLSVLAVSVIGIVRSWRMSASCRSISWRLLKLAGIALLVALPRFVLDIAQNGTPGVKAERILAFRETYAEPAFKPSVERTDGAYYGIALARRGTPLSEVLFEPHDWLRISIASFFGVYGYMNVFAPAWTYVVLPALLITLFALGARASLEDGPRRKQLVLALCVSLLVALVSLLHSWVDDLQAQGRYLFPILAMLALVLGNNALRVGAVGKCALLLAVTVSGLSYLTVAIATFAPYG